MAHLIDRHLSAIPARRWGGLLLALLLACSVGCRSGMFAGGGGEPITQLHLIATPVAIDLDGKPGPEGVGARVYASPAGAKDAVRIPRGTLKILLFDGVVSESKLSSTEPLASFSYKASELRKVEHRTAVGISYNFAPTWGARKPSMKRVTVVAVYSPGSAAEVWSGPVTVPLGK